MKYFPVFLRMAGETVVIAGGGEQAAQKARLMVKTEARIVLMAPALEPELLDLVAAGRAAHVAAVAEMAALRGARMLFCATGCAGADAALAALGRAAGALVNAVDRPDLCDAITPAIVDRDPVVVAIGTEGAAPVLARRIKTAVEAMLDPSLGGFAAWAGERRAAVAQRVAPGRRRAFWAWAFSGPLEALWRRGDRAAVEAAVEAALETGAPPVAGGAVAVVAVGPGALDLLTLRGVQRLQEADLVAFDPDLDPATLELARRDAERLALDRAPADVAGARAGGERQSPAADGRMLAAAREGRRVVRLVGGDLSGPGAARAIAALVAEGLDVEAVPGVVATDETGDERAAS